MMFYNMRKIKSCCKLAGPIIIAYLKVHRRYCAAEWGMSSYTSAFYSNTVVAHVYWENKHDPPKELIATEAA